ncbi:protein trafficking Pga2 [Lineolata rhizophorae]|uniref:Protein trafficking Pga2 n=1 Tax=Lineolata rhizophorae TaxID=578093 RepID=A0A6A6PAR6_9PEZI|nr:protein trafficking Pga2 [Lineolata rhizophorae]
MPDPAPSPAREGGVPDLSGTLSTWAANLQRNTFASFSRLRAVDYIRLVAIVGAYLLLRPYLMKLGAKLQRRDMERQNKESSENADAVAAAAEMNPNELRRGGRKAARAAEVEIPGVESEEDEEEGEAGPGMDWGRSARVRQRRFIREKLAEHEAKLREQAEAESDKEIEEFLVD